MINKEQLIIILRKRHLLFLYNVSDKRNILFFSFIAKSTGIKKNSVKAKCSELTLKY
ncbi:MAG: hypothetical protein MI784_07235 [Cytophagales bacterium]|nr:hypothetical protein [Cytophagales bacterium]